MKVLLPVFQQVYGDHPRLSKLHIANTIGLHDGNQMSSWLKVSAFCSKVVTNNPTREVVTNNPTRELFDTRHIEMVAIDVQPADPEVSAIELDAAMQAASKLAGVPQHLCGECLHAVSSLGLGT